MNPATTEETRAHLETCSLSAEQRVNAIRIAAIALFYLVHLWHLSAPQLGSQAAAIIGFDPTQPMSAGVHVVVSILCLGWLIQAFAIYFCIQQRKVSDRAILLSTLGDLTWLTAILCFSTGPGGPLVAGYFLILMMTGLRFNLWLVRVATVTAVLCYLVLLGAAKWPIGMLREINAETVPRYHQLMMLLAIAFAGVIVGQTVRHGYVLARSIRGNANEMDP